MTKLLLIMILSLGTLQSHAKKVQVEPKLQLQLLLDEADINSDKKITIEDRKVAPFVFQLETVQHHKLPVEGIYYQSNLLQELKLGVDPKKNTSSIDSSRIFENPVHRLSRLIRNLYWDGLTRKIDEKNLETILKDSKVDSSFKKYLYVPFDDKVALNYYRTISKKNKKLNLEVIRLPKKITPSYVSSLGEKHGILSLALKKVDGKISATPFVVPGGRFNEMYGWDSYFHILGLLKSNKTELAKDIIDNLVYEINHYGKILNANRTYYLTRSQPPFLTSMIRKVYPLLAHNDETMEWLKKSLRAALKEYHEVWMGEERLTSLGLSRYAGFAEGIPPEVESGHFNSILAPYAKKYGLSITELTRRFNAGKLFDKDLAEFFDHDRAVRESGHDTTYRWRMNGKDQCANFVTVDLNSLLYKYEIDIAILIKNEFQGSFENWSSDQFLELAKKRKYLIRKYLWNKKDGLFYDYNWKLGLPSSYVSATTFYPLWATDPEIPDSKILTTKEATHLKKVALKKLESQGGLTASDEVSLKRFGEPEYVRQWDYPNGWAPHQMMAWSGLIKYNFKSDAERLSYKWLFLMTKNAKNYNGTIPEKYDVVGMSHRVFAEYGNVGTKFSYITKEGFGWMNSSYLEGLDILNKDQLKKLEQLIPVEWLNFQD